MAAARGVLTHTDASQAAGKLPVDVRQLGVDFLSLTAHKFYGPKGAGALYVRETARPRIAAVHFGGGHERGLRSGTLPTHQIVGLGAAAAHRALRGAHDAAHARDLAARLARELESIPNVRFNDRHAEGVPGPHQRIVRRHRGREPHHRIAGNRRLHRIGLQLGQSRTELRAARARAGGPSWRKAR